MKLIRKSYTFLVNISSITEQIFVIFDLILLSAFSWIN